MSQEINKTHTDYMEPICRGIMPSWLSPYKEEPKEKTIIPVIVQNMGKRKNIKQFSRLSKIRTNVADG